MLPAWRKRRELTGEEFKNLERLVVKDRHTLAVVSFKYTPNSSDDPQPGRYSALVKNPNLLSIKTILSGSQYVSYYALELHLQCA